MTLLSYAAFVLLVVLPVAFGVREMPERLRDLREGIRGVCYVPLLWMLLFPVAIGAFALAEYLTILQWGWLGSNIIVTPLADGGGGGSGGGGGGGWGSSTTDLYLLVFVPLAALAFLLFNYYEEQSLYRDSYRGVFGWALIHLVMGIPIAAVIPLFAIGCGFKAIYDRKGQRVAYAAHFASNMGLLALIVLMVVFAPESLG